MAKESGLGWTTASRDNSSAALKALVNCITNVDFSITRNTQDLTGMDKSSMERLLLLGDYSSTWTLLFNDCGCKSFCVHKTIASADVLRSESLVVSGQTLNNEVALIDMALSRGADGSFIITAPAALSSGTDPTWS